MTLPVATSSLVFFSTLCVVLVGGVDRGNFKTCDQSSFCKRQRGLEEGNSPYVALPSTLNTADSSLSITLSNKRNNKNLKLELFSLEDDTIRIKINELSPLKKRYEVPDVLVTTPVLSKLALTKNDQETIELSLGPGNRLKVVILVAPFRLDVLQGSDLVASLNYRGLLHFEHLRQRSQQSNEPKEPPVEPPAPADPNNEEEKREEVKIEILEGEEEVDEPGMWEETFKSHKDTKPDGPESMGFDFSFVGFEHVYGIPEHADTLALKSTKDTDPYRLYNLDVFEYDLDNPMALYGSIPFMVAHNAAQTVGMLWLNSAEMWVDVNSNTAKSVVGKLMDYMKGSEVPQVDTHWMSESGIIDVFLMLGPTPRDVMQQYSALTGTTPLPPLFSIAYHQCRWNYNSQEDVRDVDANFDQYDIPYDVLWLDIEHTDGKKYMTWDKVKFNNPIEMQDNLASKSRKMVNIIDPHIKRDDNYHIHKEAKSLGYYVKNKDNNDYEGWCWPGTSSWMDFTSPAIRNWWADKMDPTSYQGSTVNLFTWNDMNEPSVFNGPEVSMHKDAIHYQGWEHRDVHNIYGLYQQMATAEGQVRRTKGVERPFVLSRAFFAGSQRYGAIWTGDNKAEWDHLRISLPMLMSIGVAGLPFAGADVGGFFHNPDAELLTRWYQAGSFYPFFRAHAHLDTKRREPWLLPKENMEIVRAAIRQRYALLPYWYTQFYKTQQDGMPIMRPLWMEFPEDTNTFTIENQFMVGDSLLVVPVTQPAITSIKAYFPGPKLPWYDLQSYQKVTGSTYDTVYTPLNKIPVFQRGNTIVPRKERVRRSSSLMVNDPYTLVVALSSEGTAEGSLYIDDGHSYEHKKGQYIYCNFRYSNGILSSSVQNNQGYATKSWLERVVVLGWKHKQSTSAQILVTGGDSRELDTLYDAKTQALTIRKPDVNMVLSWKIHLTSN